MIKIGDIIEGRVYRIEPYGVFLRCGEAELFVHLPELSWTEYRPANEQFALNGLLRVLILKRYPEKDQWIASVKKAQPEKNPFVDLAHISGERVLKARIVFKGAYAFLARLENGAHGDISRSEVKRPLQVGDEIDVVIKSLDVAEGKLELQLKE